MICTYLSLRASHATIVNSQLCFKMMKHKSQDAWFLQHRCHFTLELCHSTTDSLKPSSAMMSNQFTLSNVNLKMFNEALYMQYGNKCRHNSLCNWPIQKKFVLADVTLSIKLYLPQWLYSESIWPSLCIHGRAWRESWQRHTHWQTQHYSGRAAAATTSKDAQKVQ